MSTATPADAIIEHWNRSFRAWSENYIKPYKSTIVEHCLFANKELQKGHSSALKDIEKNKGNISQFVRENTEQKYAQFLPSKILSDTYSFSGNQLKHGLYKLVHRSMLSEFISWKPGTSNALSKAPLEIQYGAEHFQCKFRKYQLESMKKFIQATPGTKEIRGQWSVNLADDSMMVSFGHHMEIVVLLKIGSHPRKLQVMYEENGVLRKNSKIRKQTLKTSCWGLEKTKNSPTFENSVIIQENYSIHINADNVLAISPIAVYVNKERLHHLPYRELKIFCGDVCRLITLHKRPYHIANVSIAPLSHEQEQHLRSQYRRNVLNSSKSKSTAVVSIKEEKKSSSKRASKPKTRSVRIRKKLQISDDDSDEDDDSDVDGWNPVKPGKKNTNNNKNKNTHDNHDNHVEEDDNDDDDSFYPIKPNHRHYPRHAHRSIASVSVTSFEDTCTAAPDAVSCTNTNACPTTNTSSISFVAAPIITPTDDGILPTPQQPPLPSLPPTVHSETRINPNQNNLDNTNTRESANIDNNAMEQDAGFLTAPFTANLANELMDDALNWPSLADNAANLDLTRFSSIPQEFGANFDHVFNQLNQDTAFPLTASASNMALDNNAHVAFDDDVFSRHHPASIVSHSVDLQQHPHANLHQTNQNQMNLQEMQALRRQNDLLLQRVAEQQRQIEFLAQQMSTMRSQHAPYVPAAYDPYQAYEQYEEPYPPFTADQTAYAQRLRHPHAHLDAPQFANYAHRNMRRPLKRRRISSEALLPPAA